MAVIITGKQQSIRHRQLHQYAMKQWFNPVLRWTRHFIHIGENDMFKHVNKNIDEFSFYVETLEKAVEKEIIRKNKDWEDEKTMMKTKMRNRTLSDVPELMLASPRPYIEFLNEKGLFADIFDDR